MLNANITLRVISSSDLEYLVTLFRETVHSVNAIDYTQDQLMAWAPAHVHHSHPRWQSLLTNMTVVAEISGVIVGFADVTHVGYLDRLFVHKDYQRQGVAYQMVKHLERRACDHSIKKITTEASITAKPFFEKMGYQVLKEQRKELAEVVLTNYLMEKVL